jgi:hypothetical protein
MERRFVSKVLDNLLLYLCHLSLSVAFIQEKMGTVPDFSQPFPSILIQFQRVRFLFELMTFKLNWRG